MKSTGRLISPTLANDRRVRRSTSKRVLRGREVLKTHVNERCLNGVLSRNEERKFDTLVDNAYITTHDGRPIGVCLIDYGKKLMADPKYVQVRKTFIEKNPLTTNLAEVENKFKETLWDMLISPKPYDYVDDRTMMGFMMTSELITKALQASETVRAVKIYQTSEKVLCPGMNEEDHECLATPVMMKRWLANYDELVNPYRACDIVTEPGVQRASDADATELVTALAVPRLSVKLKPEWHLIDPRVTERDCLYEPSTEQVLHSYVINRFNDQPFVHRIKDFLIFQRRVVNLANRAIGVTMLDYGNAIRQTTYYEKLKRRFVIRLLYSDDLEVDLLNFMKHYILVPGDMILYDRIMTVCMLISDVVNRTMTNNNPEKAYKLYTLGAKILENDKRTFAVVSAGWREMKDIKDRLVSRKVFDIMSDTSFLYDLPAQPVIVPDSVKRLAERQRRPLITRDMGAMQGRLSCDDDKSSRFTSLVTLPTLTSLKECKTTKISRISKTSTEDYQDIAGPPSDSQAEADYVDPCIFDEISSDGRESVFLRNDGETPPLPQAPSSEMFCARRSVEDIVTDEN